MAYVIKRKDVYFVKVEDEKKTPCYTWSESEARAKKFDSRKEADAFRKRLHGDTATVLLKEKKTEIKERGKKKEGKKDDRRKAQ